MKSSFELAMERLGGIRDLPPEKKKLIAEIESKFKAKIAQAEMSAQDKIRKCGTADEIEKIRSALASELASLREKSEREKEKARSQA